MREDVLAKRMFLAGCLGLPWLWAVHVLYWYRKQHPNPLMDDDHQGALLANNSSSDTDGSADDQQDSRSPEEVKAEAKKWVKRSFYGAVGVFSAWAMWIIMFHIFADKFPPSWFVRSEDEADFTGW